MNDEESDILMLEIELYQAVIDGNTWKINQLLIRDRVNPNVMLPGYELAPIHLAIGQVKDTIALEIINTLLANGGDPNIKTSDGSIPKYCTPLHIAVAWNRSIVVGSLLKHGANPYLKNGDGNDGFHVAKIYGASDSMRILFCYNTNHFGNTETDFIRYFNGEVLRATKEALGEKKLREKCQMGIALEGELYKKPALSSIVKNENSISALSSLKIDLKENIGHSSSLMGGNRNDIDVAYSYNDCNEGKNTFAKRRSYSVSSNDSSIPSDYLTASESSQYKFNISKITPVPKENEMVYNRRKDKSRICLSHNSSLFPDICTFADDNFLEETIASKAEKTSGIKCGLNDGFINTSTSSLENTANSEKKTVEDHLMNNSVPEIVIDSDSSSSVSCDTATIRTELIKRGFNPGPIGSSTKRLYWLKLKLLRMPKPVLSYPTLTDCSPELGRVLCDEKNWESIIETWSVLEREMRESFEKNAGKLSGEGGKTFFTYLLLDSRVSLNLPGRCHQMQLGQVWNTFLASIFYVGKGIGIRPYNHLYEAARFLDEKNDGKQHHTPKVARILEIWRSGAGVVCFQAFHNLLAAEAFTREAAMIAALGLNRLTNVNAAHFYDLTQTWNHKLKIRLGIYLLYRAMKIFIANDEIELKVADV